MASKSITPPLPRHNAAFDIVAMAASFGGVKALGSVLSQLPQDFPSAIVVVQHVARDRKSSMAQILSRRTVLRVKQAEQGDLLQSGMVYVAPPDNHLMVS